MFTIFGPKRHKGGRKPEVKSQPPGEKLEATSPAPGAASAVASRYRSVSFRTLPRVVAQLGDRFTRFDFFEISNLRSEILDFG